MQLHPLLFLSTCISSLVTATETTEDQYFQIPQINAHQPSGRPGNSPYCSITFTLIDASSKLNTTCSVEHNCGLGGDPKPLPTKQVPKFCDDPSFNFYVPEYRDIGNFSLHAEHQFVDGENISTTHEATSMAINSTNYPDGYRYICGGSGVCNVAFTNEASPIVLASEI